MQNDIQCHTCGLWFGSEELALLHLRVLHPTDVNDKKSSRHPNLLLKAISRTILWVVSTRRVGKANRSTSLPVQPRDAGHGHLPQPVPPRYTAAIYQVGIA